jgi:Ca2+-transporting ATPase
LLVLVVVAASRKKNRIEGFADFVGCVLQEFQKFRVSLEAVKAAWRFHDGKTKTLVLKFCFEKSSMTVLFAHVSKSLVEYKLLTLCTILFFSMFTNQTFFWSFQAAIPLFPESYLFLAVIVAGLKHAQINRKLWYDFRIDVKSLAQMVGGQDTKALEDNNGVVGVAEKLQTSLCDGLCSDAIYKTLEAFGANTYTEVPPKAFWVFVVEAWHDMTLIILSICVVVSLAIGIPTEGWEEGWYDGAGIAFSVFLVVFVTAVSDYQQSLQFRDLDKEKRKIFVDVTRDKCRQKICIFDLLVGDIVHLKIGDQVPADGLYVSGCTVTIDESSMTGESQPSIKDESKPFLLSGTKVQDGSGKMLVTGVGMNTEWGHLMAKLGEEDDDETPLQVKLCGVATLIGQIGVGFAVLTFLVLIGRFLYAKESLKVWSLEDALTTVDYFAIAVTIVVVAVPEGLPLAVTLTLAFAMKKMMADKALVRHLSACETMGSATTICSDKTGTLTSNKMNVVKAWAAGSVYEEFGRMKDNLPVKLVHTLVEGVFINSDGDISENKDGLPPSLLGTPTDTAILGFGLKLGGNFQEVRSKCEVVKMEPFNSKRKMMGVVVKHPENGELIAHWKGASEIVLQLCDRTIDANGSIVKLDEQKREHLNGVITTFADEALRTLCLAFRQVEVIPGSHEPIPNEGFVLVSIVGIKDPLRPGAKEAVRLCCEAGIKVRMVTGDNLHTAMAIARECGILIDDREAIEGPEFRKLLSMDPVAMEERIRKLQVNLKSSMRIQYCIVILRKKLMLTQNEYLHPFLVVSM